MFLALLGPPVIYIDLALQQALGEHTPLPPDYGATRFIAWAFSCRLPLGYRPGIRVEITIDEFKLIQDQLDQRDVETLRLVSRACRHVSEPIVFRTLPLHDVTH